jgi:hypothetical protein
MRKVKTWGPVRFIALQPETTAPLETAPEAVVARGASQ